MLATCLIALQQHRDPHFGPETAKQAFRRPDIEQIRMHLDNLVISPNVFRSEILSQTASVGYSINFNLVPGEMSSKLIELVLHFFPLPRWLICAIRISFQARRLNRSETAL